MKILAIGNSFSQDATAYLQKLAKSANVNLMVRNCFVGGCSLRQHVHFIQTNELAYEYQEDGIPFKMITLENALFEEKWDVITLQQASHDSGIEDSYYPYLEQLIHFVKQKSPQAKIVFHQTWPYELGSTHPAFSIYDSDPDRMYRQLKKTMEKVCNDFQLPLIPAGDWIYHFASKTKIPMYRDGFHLSFDYGRWIAGLIWLSFFTHTDYHQVRYYPEGTDPEIIQFILNELNQGHNHR